MKFTRRQLIKAGVGLAAGSSLINPVLAQTPLNMTTIPSSGQQIPSIGMGCRNYRGDANSAEMPVFRETFATYHRLGGNTRRACRILGIDYKTLQSRLSSEV